VANTHYHFPVILKGDALSLWSISRSE
jgi:hypothetical protein